MARIMLLGVAQDAGVPQTGCRCANCEDVWSGRAPPKYAVSLAIIDEAAQMSWLIDCSPDFKQQYRLLQEAAPTCKPQGVFLTHLHMGHYVGLFQFGLEVMNWSGLKVWGTPSVHKFFTDNQPWQQFISGGVFDLQPLVPERPVRLTDGLTVRAVHVPHRGEYSDTVAYTVSGPNAHVFYCPDIDSWEEWDLSVRDVVSGVDLALLDACFYSPSELPRRDIGRIPHPLITHTAEVLAGLESKVGLIHMNHTNPVHRDGEERRWCLQRGFLLPHQGECWPL